MGSPFRHRLPVTDIGLRRCPVAIVVSLASPGQESKVPWPNVPGRRPANPGSR